MRTARPDTSTMPVRGSTSTRELVSRLTSERPCVGETVARPVRSSTSATPRTTPNAHLQHAVTLDPHDDAAGRGADSAVAQDVHAPTTLGGPGPGAPTLRLGCDCRSVSTVDLGELPVIGHVPRRRLVTVPGVAMIAGGLAATVPVWLPSAIAYDLLRAPRRMPWTRVLSFSLVWSGLETVGVGASAALWALGMSGRPDPHYGLQRWWATRLVDGLRLVCDLDIEVEGADALSPGPIVMCVRHASHPDALLPAWLLADGPGMRPRYVLKREMLLDPSLDVVGNRVPNHFIDRGAEDSGPELEALEELGRGMGRRDAAVIFPEGTFARDATRRRALAWIAERDPERASRVSALRHLLPPRGGGTAALLRGSPDADVVLMAHVGLERLSRLVDAPGAVPFADPVRVRLWRWRRAEVPEGDDFLPWLDDAWLLLDDWVDRQLPRSGARHGA